MHCAYLNTSKAIASRIHLLAKSRETRLPGYFGGCTKSLHTSNGVFQLCRQGTAHLRVRNLLRILSRGDRLCHRSCQTNPDLFTERLHACLEIWQIHWISTL